MTMRMPLALHPGMSEPDAEPLPSVLEPEVAAALQIPGLQPLPVALQRRVVKPSCYTLMVRIQLPGRPGAKSG